MARKGNPFTVPIWEADDPEKQYALIREMVTKGYDDDEIEDFFSRSCNGGIEVTSYTISVAFRAKRIRGYVERRRKDGTDREGSGGGEEDSKDSSGKVSLREI